LSTQRSDRGAPRRAPRRLDRQRPWGLIAAVALVVAVLAAFVVALVLDLRSGGGGPPGEVEDVNVGQAGQHTEGVVDYPQSPPAGGEHNPVWQNEGFYEEPVRNETAVHTLEHGAVWITYQPDLPQEQQAAIRDLVEGQTCILASPYPGLDSPVVASAWGKQLRLEVAERPDLDSFVQTYLQGPQTPEPGAACTGGTADPA
jgi:Protein of unknown function (DUF3105)